MKYSHVEHTGVVLMGTALIATTSYLILGLGMAIVLGLVTFAFGGWQVHRMKLLEGSSTDTKVVSGHRLSRVAKELRAEYNALPEDSRPFPEIDGLLHALDQTFIGKEHARDAHFNANWLPFTKRTCGPYLFDWRIYTRCYHHSCEFKAYYDLHITIKKVQDSLTEKRKIEAIAAVQGDLDMLKQLEEHLRDEAKVNNTFVQKFKELG